MTVSVEDGTTYVESELRLRLGDYGLLLMRQQMQHCGGSCDGKALYLWIIILFACGAVIKESKCSVMQSYIEIFCLFSLRLSILANPEAVISSPVPQLSIPINRHFHVVRGKWLLCCAICF